MAGTETLLFFGTCSGGSTIWHSKSSGSNTSFEPVQPIEVVSAGSSSELQSPGPIVFYLNNKIYAQSGDNNLLVWDTNGSSSTSDWTHNTYAYTGHGNTSNGLYPQGFAYYGETLGHSLLYFNGTYQAPNSLGTVGELFTTDHLTMIPGPNGPGGGLNPSSFALAAFDNNTQLFFSGYNGDVDDDGNQYNVLFAYDGSGTPAPVPGVNVVNPAYLTVAFVGTEIFSEQNPILSPPPLLFMSGQDSSAQGAPRWLYRYDGKNLTKIAPAAASSSVGLRPYNLTNGPGPGSPVHPVPPGKEFALSAALFFSGVNAHGKTGLWMSLGTTETTREITTTKPSGTKNNNASVYPFNLTAWNGMLYFTAYDTYINEFASQRGLFVYNPVENHVSEPIKSSTAALDPQFSTIWEGLNQTTMTVFNNDLYFSASSNESSGLSDLFRANLNAQGTGASPTLVASVAEFGVVPYSLTTVYVGESL
jgi:hypothetical protein